MWRHHARVFFTMTLPNAPRKRWRPTALQDATATSGLPRQPARLWTAPVLWRFGGRVASRLAYRNHGSAGGRAAKSVENYRSPRRLRNFSAGSESLKLMAVGIAASHRQPDCRPGRSAFFPFRRTEVVSAPHPHSPRFPFLRGANARFAFIEQDCVFVGEPLELHARDRFADKSFDPDDTH